MSARTRRRTGLRNGILASLPIALLWGAGCSRPVLPAGPHRFVRVDALLPLHPSWAQIRAFDAEIARIKVTAAQAPPLKYEPHRSLPLFTPHVSTPENLAKERAAQIDRDAARYIESLRGSLNATNQSILSLERRREQRRVDAAVAARLAAAIELRRSVNAVNSFAIHKRLESLAFRDIVVRSQIQDLAQAHTRDLGPLRQAQTEHAAILAEMERLRAENRKLLTENYAAETAPLRSRFFQEESARSKERLAKREQELNSSARDKLAAAVRDEHDTAIPAPATPDLPPPDPRTTPLPLPEERSEAVSPASLQPVVDRESAGWQAERETLIAEIRADTWKAVQQAARRRGWKLVSGPQPGAVDGTDEAAKDLRDQWLPTKGP